MIAYPNIDPVLIEIGPLAIRWYSCPEHTSNALFVQLNFTLNFLKHCSSICEQSDRSPSKLAPFGYDGHSLAKFAQYSTPLG